MQINQFHSGTAVGDAITNQMLMIKELLEKNGFCSEIYAEFVDSRLSKSIKNIVSYKGNKDSILIVHHSMCINCFDKIKNLPDKKILVYHNITPEKFFEDQGLKKAIRLGLKQAEDYREIVDYVIAASNYNRQELIRMGYSSDIDVMPVNISLERFEKIESEKKVFQNKAQVNILFVGRIVPNKKQNDVITAFSVYHNYFNADSKLFIVGNDEMTVYVKELKQLATRLKVADAVCFSGKVSEAELKAYYEMADVFLCMSEHEGFGVPLLEAMKMEVPVIAFRSSAVAETMDHAGIVVTEKNYAYIGALINELIENKDLYKKIVARQSLRIAKMDQFSTEEILMKAISNLQTGARRRTIQLQGPFETSYSLAIVNRKLMEAMDDLGKADISIYCTEGPGDYEPKAKDLKNVPHAAELWKKSVQVKYPDITIRNMYPPRVNDVNGGINFLAFGWEESVIPHKYIKEFNKFLTGIGTMSDYVTEKLIECGLTIPVKTMGIGVELVSNFDALLPYPVNSQRKVKFLHISSAFPRKGVDILLKAYFEAFTSEDDVCLILKTFPNPHNNVEQQLIELKQKYPNFPEVEWINQDLSNEELCSLYKVADCYVHAARGEGFGLPVAEAMLAKVPVIVSPNSGLADFCNENTAFLVSSELQPADTHLTSIENRISMWSEPNIDELVQWLRKFYGGIEEDIVTSKVEAAYNLIKEKYTWEKVANRWYTFINEVEEGLYKPKVAMVTTWNNKCGIAEFTKMEVESSKFYVDYQIYPNYGVELVSKDEEIVQPRVWHSAFEGTLQTLVNDVINSNNQIIHFQFNFGFFELRDFAKAIEKISQKKKVVITFHKTADANINGKRISLKSIVRELNMCSTLVVHQDADAEYLKSIGVLENKINKIVLGQVVYPEISSTYAKEKLGITSSLVIGSYGFLLPHKGIKEVVNAIAEVKKNVPDILYLPVCAMHESGASKQYYKECIQEVEKLGLQENVKFVTDYLDNDESMKYLQACDIMVMPYHPSQESASGAIRFCLAALRPTITTEQEIFAEFRDCTYQIKECTSKLIATSVMKLLDSEEQQRYISKTKNYIKDNAWNVGAYKYYQLYMNILKKL